MRIKDKDGKTVDVKLPKAFKKKWLKALRSGKYEQTTGELQSWSGEDKYCCLGVACRVQHPKMDIKGMGTISENNFKRLRDVNVPEILKGDIDTNPLILKLTTLNDDKGWSFKRIATYIEKYL